MGVKISDIKDTQLQAIAKQVDNGDGVLKRKEYSLFAQEASRQGVDAKAISEALDMNGLQRWWYDVDKVSTDGKDDGKVSAGEKAKSFAKGLFGGLVKTIVKNPLESILTIGAFAGGLAILGAVTTPFVAAAVGVVAGIWFGAAALVKGINQTRNAKIDGEAKMGMENAGTGTSMIALSGLGLKGVLSKFKAKNFKPVKEVQPKNNNMQQKPLQLMEPSAETVTKSKPIVNCARATGYNLEELEMSQVIKPDGTHVRYYRRPGEKQLALVTEDLGSLHKETIYGFKGEGNITTITKTGKNEISISHRTPSGEFRNYSEDVVFADGINQKVVTNSYYTSQYNYGVNFGVVEKYGINGQHTIEKSIAVGDVPLRNSTLNSSIKNFKISKLSGVREYEYNELPGFELDIQDPYVDCHLQYPQKGVPINKVQVYSINDLFFKEKWELMDNKYNDIDLSSLLKPFEE